MANQVIAAELIMLCKSLIGFSWNTFCLVKPSTSAPHLHPPHPYLLMERSTNCCHFLQCLLQRATYCALISVAASVNQTNICHPDKKCAASSHCADCCIAVPCYAMLGCAVSPIVCGNYLLLPSCTSVDRALVCQPSEPGSNPGSLVQSQLLPGGTYLAAAYIHVIVLQHDYCVNSSNWSW